tara:strand:- start:2666 stop:4414 length:1749 start_codon:yes stop_codon:yes gene_type:complete
MYEKNILVNIEGNEIDLFEYIDKNSKLLKEQYLNIIFDLSNLTLNNQPLKNQLYFQDHSLWEMSLIQEKNIYKNSYIFKTIKYLALKKIIKENKNKNIEIFFLENDLANYLEKEFETAKIIFNNKLDSFKVKIIQIIKKKIWFQFLFFIYYFLKNCTFRKFNNKVFSKKKFFIFSYFTHYDKERFNNENFYPKQWSNLWENIIDNSNFFQIFLPNKKFKFFFQLENFLKKKNFKNLKNENFINYFIFYKYFFKVFKDFKLYRSKDIYLSIVEKIKDNKDFKYFFEINEELFISSFAGYTLLQNLLWINIFENLFKNLPKHDYGLYIFENQPWEKAFVRCWQKYNQGELIGYCHTTINFWHLNYFNIEDYNRLDDYKKFSPDFIAVSSEISKNFIVNQSIDLNKIIEVEALRYNWILNNKVKLNNTFDKNKKILFLGDYEKNINKNLIRIMNQSKDDLIKLGFEVSFKPHPATKVKNIDDNITLTDRDLEKLINAHNYIVSSNSTSAVIEALSCGLITFLFVDKNNLNLSPLKNTKIEKKVDFFSTKEELIYKIANFKNNLEPIEYYYLDKELKKWKKTLKIS